MNSPSPSPSRTGPTLRWLSWAAALAVILGTLAAYSPVLRAGFIWDDDGHVTRPALEGLSGLGKIWVQLGATQQYYPVLHSAFWLEHRVWGDAPGPYHVANVLEHSIAACLLAFLVESLLGSGPTGAFRDARNRWLAAWATAVLFALHPMGVESVAWVSEQKNTLSAVFGFWSALVYIRSGRSSRGWGYGASSLLFAAAILTKSVTVTLPAALLVLLWWREGRLERRDIARLLPWLVAGAAMGYTTAWVERTYIGANGGSFSLDAASKGALAGRIAWFYATTWAWPRELLFEYPRWSIVGEPREWIGTIGVLAVVGLGFALAPTRPRSARGNVALSGNALTGARVLQRLPVCLLLCGRPFRISGDCGPRRGAGDRRRRLDASRRWAARGRLCEPDCGDSGGMRGRDLQRRGETVCLRGGTLSTDPRGKSGRVARPREPWHDPS